MATDGEIDYRAFTREQLDLAIGRGDHVRYPLNYRNLVSEYKRRRNEEIEAASACGKIASTAVVDGKLPAPGDESSSALECKIAFEPNARRGAWLGPSRNDFRFVGSGTLHVNRDSVCVSGRRYVAVLGLPLTRQAELVLQNIVNVEIEGNALRFEYLAPVGAIRALTVWLTSQSEAERLVRVLPENRTPDFTARLNDHVEFERRLVAQSPRIPVTYGFLLTNACVFLALFLATHDLVGLDSSLLVAMGSNFGPYTSDGEWWRLLTSMFLHVGIVHLAFNLWALASFGPIVERLYGSLSYLGIYLVAGLGGSEASIIWRPEINSVGASGAIFGILGALIAAQLRNGSSIPTSVLRPLRFSSVVFTCCALAAGFISIGVDNADHVGGLMAGFLTGLVLSRPVTGLRAGMNGRSISRWVRMLLLAALLLGTGVWAAQRSSSRLTGESLFWHTFHWFVPGEVAAIDRWKELGELAAAGKLLDDIYASRLDREVIPFWREAASRLSKIDLEATSPSYQNLEFMRTITFGRLHAYKLAVNGLRRHDVKATRTAGEELTHIDDLIIDKRSTEAHKQ